MTEPEAPQSMPSERLTSECADATHMRLRERMLRIKQEMWDALDREQHAVATPRHEGAKLAVARASEDFDVISTVLRAYEFMASAARPTPASEPAEPAGEQAAAPSPTEESWCAQKERELGPEAIARAAEQVAAEASAELAVNEARPKFVKEVRYYLDMLGEESWPSHALGHIEQAAAEFRALLTEQSKVAHGEEPEPENSPKRCDTCDREKWEESGAMCNDPFHSAPREKP